MLKASNLNTAGATHARMDELPEIRSGKIFIEMLWFEVAKRVVERAAVIYELTPEQRDALKRAYLRPGDYICQIA